MFTQDELTSKTGPELVEIFNGLPGVQQVKRFTNRDTGIRRILASQSTEVVDKPLVGDSHESELNAENRPSPNDGVLPTKRGRKKQPRGTYNLEAGPVVRSFRANSARGRLLAVLTSEGATFASLLETFSEWNEDQLHKTIRMANWWLGFAISTDDSGIITASR